MYSDELYHHGILGQRWGIRRYQKKDGSLTPAGLKRYGSEANFKKIQRAEATAKKEAEKILNQVRKDVEKMKRDAALEQKEEAHKQKMDLEKEIREKK